MVGSPDMVSSGIANPDFINATITNLESYRYQLEIVSDKLPDKNHYKPQVLKEFAIVALSKRLLELGANNVDSYDLLNFSKNGEGSELGRLYHGTDLGDKVIDEIAKMINEQLRDAVFEGQTTLPIDGMDYSPLAIGYQSSSIFRPVTSLVIATPYADTPVKPELWEEYNHQADYDAASKIHVRLTMRALLITEICNGISSGKFKQIETRYEPFEKQSPRYEIVPEELFEESIGRAESVFNTRLGIHGKQLLGSLAVNAISGFGLTKQVLSTPRKVIRESYIV